MSIAATIVNLLLAVAMLGSGYSKLTGQKAALETLTRVGFPADRAWLLAAAEIAGAVGLVGGLFWWPLGVAAATGLILYFVGAVGSHLRVRDFGGIAPAAVMLLIAITSLALQLAAR